MSAAQKGARLEGRAEVGHVQGQGWRIRVAVQVHRIALVGRAGRHQAQHDRAVRVRRAPQAQVAARQQRPAPRACAPGVTFPVSHACDRAAVSRTASRQRLSTF
jgi:hypothetical protein